jgi:hypothetical protein
MTIIETNILLVQQVLTPDLLRGRWKNRSPNVHPTDGHCYVAAEALWHLLGTSQYQPFVAAYTDNGGRATHWWLVNKTTGEFADPTKEQYTHVGDSPPYHLGRKAVFLTKNPSKRAQIVLDRIMKLNE